MRPPIILCSLLPQTLLAVDLVFYIISRQSTKKIFHTLHTRFRYSNEIRQCRVPNYIDFRQHIYTYLYIQHITWVEIQAKECTSMYHSVQLGRLPS